MGVKRNYSYIKILWLLFISLMFIEGTFHIVMFKSLFDKDMALVCIFTLGMCTFLSWIIQFFKPIWTKLSMCFITFFFGLYAMIQMNLKSFLTNYLSFNQASDGGLGRVMDQLGPFFKNIKWEYLLTFIPFIILIILFIFRKNIFDKVKFTYVSIIIPLVLTVMMHLTSFYTLDLFSDKNQIRSNKKLYKNPVLIDLVIKNFGPSRFFFLDIRSIIFPVKEDVVEIIIPADNQTSEEPENDYTRHIDDTAWISKMENEKDKSIKSLDEFFLSQPITPKNEMTGIFKDKNLVLVMVEAFDYTAIHPELTPTLYKLKTEGWFFDNYYAPKYSCTTGESEYIGETSVIPSISLCTPNSYKNNTYKTSIFNVFNNTGYYSSSYHSWKDQFYDRDVLHINMGSSVYYNYNTLGLKVRDGWPSDENLFKASYPYFHTDDKFFSFVVTASTHFPYDASTDISNKYWDLVKDYNYPNKIKTYLTKAIDLDRGLQSLIESLEADGKLDDTVIVLFGDHHPLNMELSYLNNMSSIDRLEDFNIDRLPFIIYNSEVEPQVYSQTMSSFDILPTLSNLFDLNYDPRYYVGKDAFSDEERIVIFPSGSWITDKAIYFSSKGNYKSLVDNLDNDYIKRINDKVNNYFTVSNLVLTKDYYKYR